MDIRWDRDGEEMNMHFDVVSFTFSDDVCENKVFLHGKRVLIPQVKTDVPGL